MALPAFITSLAPPKRSQADKDAALNPIQLLMSLTTMQYLLFLSGFLAWSMDAYDFFSVSLTVPLLVTQFNRSTHDITTAITLTLLFRSVGAVIFGVISDRYGRKWPLVANLILIAILELGSGFVNTYHQFLAVRSLFGLGMGGIWGQAASTALENMPVEARGLFSGILQEGYAFGYLIAAVVDLKLVPKNPHSWRSLFWLGSGLSLATALFRAVLPESELFLRAREEARARGQLMSQKEKTKHFLHEVMLKKHWLLCIYAVLLMTGFNFLSHGSQDLYPTFMKTSKGFSAYDATVATIIGNCGAIAGGILAGWLSQRLGRRLTIIIFTLSIGAFIPLWILPTKFGALSAGAFFIQVGVQGAWGVIPIHLNELSPPGFRSTFPGVAYQLGNMVSSAASQIEATAGDHIKTTIIEGGKATVVPDYGKVQGILIGVVAAFVILMTVIGTENRARHFEKAKLAIEADAGESDMDEVFDKAEHGRASGATGRSPTGINNEKSDAIMTEDIGDSNEKAVIE
ncbi:hypothetical protein FRB96_009558 [Tulasnella sp. 330]|nr:hypothetical protein FRB96_009558 [Tulasnella sp. 330]KAG8874248.1 hypothetical protein FRB97_006064 [Tulasnella sp. 331]